MKRTLKRELKVLEIVEREAIGGSGAARPWASPRGRLSARAAGQRGLVLRDKRGGRHPADAAARAEDVRRFKCTAPPRRWQNGFNRPVLKHGPRSLTCTRVRGWQPRRRKETDWWDPQGAPSTDHDLL